MSKTHDYDTKFIAFKYLNGTHVIVGECGGLSAVLTPTYPTERGYYSVDTEHGNLHSFGDDLVQVLA